MKYRSEIDGLRAIAVVPVILFHAGFEIFSGGFVGVDVFFVISGYLITTIIINEMDEGKFSLLSFYERRARRILPALFFVVLCCIPFACFLLLPSDMKDFSQSLVAVATFSSNILFWREGGYFDTAAELKPLLHTWSLAVEEQFYILFPLFLMAAWRFGKRANVWTLVAAFVISLAMAQWGAYNKPSATFYLLPTRAWELLIGSFAAFYLQNRTVSTSAWSNNVLSAIGLVAILYSVFAFDDATPFPSLYALVPTVGAVLIILFAVRGTAVHSLLSTRGFVSLGLISYSLYLWHQPVFAFWRHYHVLEPTHLQMIFLTSCCLSLAYLTYQFVERPLRLKEFISTHVQIFTISTVGILSFLMFGFLGNFSNGFYGLRSGSAIARYDVMRQLAQDRQAAIRAGVCHFNQRGLHFNLDEFLLNWSCNTAAEEGQPRIAVYGDSHAADKAVALRENGIFPTQLGGADCPLLLHSIPSYCDALLERFVEEVSENEYEFILLSNRFSDTELTPQYLSKLAEFWSSLNANILLFSPMPEREGFKRVYAQSPEFATQMRGDTLSSAVFYENLNSITLPSNIYVINTEEIFCQIADQCSSAVAGVPLLTDYGHLSIHGAKLFGLHLSPLLFNDESLTVEQ